MGASLQDIAAQQQLGSLRDDTARWPSRLVSCTEVQTLTSYRAGNYQTQSWGPRTPLCLAISEDDGKTWKLWATLEDAPPPEDFKRVIALETGIVNDGRSEFSWVSRTSMKRHC